MTIPGVSPTWPIMWSIVGYLIGEETVISIIYSQLMLWAYTLLARIMIDNRLFTKSLERQLNSSGVMPCPPCGQPHIKYYKYLSKASSYLSCFWAMAFSKPLNKRCLWLPGNKKGLVATVGGFSLGKIIKWTRHYIKDASYQDNSALTATFFCPWLLLNF